MAKKVTSFEVDEQQLAAKLAADGTIPLQQLAKLLMISVEWVRKLHKAGYIPKTGTDRYPLVGAVQGYIRYMKDEERRTSKVQADSRFRDGRTKEIELRIAEKQRDLIPIEDARAEVAAMVSDTRAEMMGLGARVTRDLDMRRSIDNEVTGILSRLAQRAEKASHALETGSGTMGAGEEAVA